MKITKQNYKKIIKELKEKDTMVYTERGKRKPASEVDFTLVWNVKGKWDLVAKVK